MKQSVEIHTPFIKLDQLLKFAGLTGSGSDSRYFIEDGAVTVDGEVELRRGRKIYPGMEVAVSLDEGEFCIEVTGA